MLNKEFIDDDIFTDDSDDFVESIKSNDIENVEIQNEEIIKEESKEKHIIETSLKSETIEQPLNKVASPQTQPQTKTESLNTIPSKPLLQIKELNDNPYADRYQRTANQKNNNQAKNNTEKNNKDKKKQQKFNNNQNSVTSKKLISISQKNIEVLTILKNLDRKYDSESDFICQAIIEKYERDNETKNKDSDIKSLVKNALDELVGEKFIVLKGSSDISIANGHQFVENGNTYVEQSSVNKAIDDRDEQENKDLLLGILGGLDDDDDYC